MGNNWTYQSNNNSFGYDHVPNPIYGADVDVHYIIGRNGVAGCDYNFTAPANQTTQNAVVSAQPFVPAEALFTELYVECTESVVGVGMTDFQIQLIVAASNNVVVIPLTTCKTIGQEVFATLDNSEKSSVRLIIVGGKPTGCNWSALTAGKWRLHCHYKDFSKL